jgi:hypothetical protein
MKLEIFTLESIGAWKVVEWEDVMNVISSTWAYKCKRYPAGLIEKFKARFCACRDQQLEGIDFFETYAPVVQWSMIHLIFCFRVQGDSICLICMQISMRAKCFTLTCQWYPPSMARIKKKCALTCYWCIYAHNFFELCLRLISSQFFAPGNVR